MHIAFDVDLHLPAALMPLLEARELCQLPGGPIYNEVRGDRSIVDQLSPVLTQILGRPDAARADWNDLIHVGEMAPVIRLSAGHLRVNEMPWGHTSWEGGSPVFESERASPARRGLVPATRIYQAGDIVDPATAVAPATVSYDADPSVCMAAAVWLPSPHFGMPDSFRLMTRPAEGDLAKGCHRQVLFIARKDWPTWLSSTSDARHLHQWNPWKGLPAQSH